ncbi:MULTISPECIES: antibiotic biosynthesis monooxygenase family protein [unclassified Streptomyces]|uniref:antibiotic biosynthesis monooxygenase family protein n=1 Tax=unclassified Streptomyces TaxID=2593676 RepID=UPI00093FDBD9|nr:antibiotic biosynthesis monooxygenase family protein [Streptomyces sp. CB02414]OKI81350.1 hypothetical protein AMK11_25625 [Streptomyces sp. CB02414]
MTSIRPASSPAVRPESRGLPDVRRPDASAVFVAARHVPGRAAGLTALQGMVDQWREVPWPAGVLSLSCFLNTDEDTVLTYAQCAEPDAYRALLDSVGGPAAAEPVAYRPHRSLVLNPGEPGCVIVAMFDVDGPGRQQLIIDSIAATVAEAADRHPGMLSANFHVSEDGTRVLNYAEWTSDAAHIAFLEGATHGATRRVSDATPGVRPIGFKRYHLHHALGV